MRGMELKFALGIRIVDAMELLKICVSTHYSRLCDAL